MNKGIAAVTTALILVAGVWISTLLSNQKQPMQRMSMPERQKPVQIETVRNESLHTSFTLTGLLYAPDKVELYAEVSGVLHPTSKPLKEGNRFSEGEPLVRLDDGVYRNNVLAQKSGLLNQLTRLLPDLTVDFPRSAPLWEQYLDRLDLDAPLAPLPEPKSEQEKYYIAARNIYSQYYTIKGMEETLAKYTLRAPYDGVVTASHINPGTLVRVGQKLGEFTRTGIYEMAADAGISEVQHLAVGEEVHLTCDDIPGEFEGRIERIGEVVDRSSQQMNVYITIREGRLKEGLYMTAHVTSTPIEHAFRIPRSARVGQDQVWVVRDSALALERMIIAAYEDAYLIVQGLEDGAQVLAEPLSDAYVGMQVPVGSEPPTEEKPEGTPTSTEKGKAPAKGSR